VHDHRKAIGGALLAALLAAAPLFALDPSRALTQARLSVWTNESGLPQTTVNTILQTSDGYLWIGTEEGLARFDGLRFVVSDPRNAPALRNPFVMALLEAPDHSLLIGTYGGGIARLHDGRIEPFHADILGSDRIRQFHAAADGVVFVATAGGGLLRIDGAHVSRFTTHDGLPSDRIWAIEDDGSGGLWLATHGGGVVRWSGGRVVQRITTREGLPNDVAPALHRDGDGTLWIGTDGGGVVAWRNGAIAQRITTRDGLPSDFVRTLRRDRDGTLWIGTDRGVARWRGARAESMSVAEGLPSPAIRSMIEDREGSLWIGTTGGLVQLRDTRVLSYTRREGLPVDGMRALLETRNGDVWAGTEEGGMCRILPAPVHCLTTANGLPHDTVYALIESRDGSIWAGTDGGGVARVRDGKVVETIDQRSASLPNDRVRAVVENADGSLWVSTSDGLALVRGKHATEVPEFKGRQLRPLLALGDGGILAGTDGAGVWRVSADGTRVSAVAGAGRGLESDRVFSLARDADGNGVWIGTSGGGLARLDLSRGTVQSLTRHDGLYDDVVFQVVDPGTGADLWLTSNRGVYRVSRERVRDAMLRKRGNLTGTVYGTVDGMPSSECNGAFPGAMSARDGRIWVATSRGIAVIAPNASGRNDVPPPVRIEEALIDGRRSSDSALRIPPGAQRLELRYTALSLRAPERVTFRYMLEGYDRGWVEAGTNRVATYTKLAPGNYVFRVMAANEDGVPSAHEARLGLTVVPRWFETWWARLLAVVLLAAVLWMIVRLRMAALRQRHTELEAVVAERTRSLRAETERAEAASRAKSDFLANMSHELRTPLNAVLGFVQLMERRRGRDDVDREHLAIINRSGEHLLGLINEVLSLSKIEAGLAKRTDAPFNLVRLLRGLGDLFQARAQAKGLAFDVEIDPSANVIVSGDEGKLRQIVLNVLGNAVKFTESGSVVLRAAWSNGRATIEVEDTGPGIDDREQQELFAPFAQTESGRRSNEGTGLGLAISRGLARIHDGDVTIRSRRGEGTVVRIELALPLASEAPVRGARSAARVIGLAPGQKPPRILVVDDSAENRQLLAELLHSAGCEVIEAADGREALARWRGESIDLVFLDLRMHGMSGFETLRVMRAEQPQCRIVVISASAFDHERVEALQRGADAFLAKPFREQAVFAHIEQLLGVRFLREESAVVHATEEALQRLASLPAQLRTRISSAAAGGESDALQKLAAEAATHDAAAGAELAALARSYRFDEIEAALEQPEST